MTLLKTYNQNNIVSGRQSGFTLIEMLVTLGLAGIILLIGLPMGFDAYQRYAFASDKSIFINALQKARIRAASNVAQTEHGIKIGDDRYIIFRGPSYVGSTTDEIINKNANLTISGTSEIVFSQLSGDSSFNGELVISDSFRTAKINTNSEGGISW